MSNRSPVALLTTCMLSLTCLLRSVWSLKLGFIPTGVSCITSRVRGNTTHKRDCRWTPKNLEYWWTPLKPHVLYLFHSTLLLASHYIIHLFTDWCWSSKIKSVSTTYISTTPAELIFHAYKLDGLAAETLNICLHERKGRDCGILAKADKFTLSRFEGNRICETARGRREKEKDEQSPNQQEQTGWNYSRYLRWCLSKHHLCYLCVTTWAGSNFSQ